MDVVDILVSIVVVTILVTIILAIVTYVAYKLRLSREPARREEEEVGPRYFVRYDPPGAPTPAPGASAEPGPVAAPPVEEELRVSEGEGGRDASASA